jgi:predicted dehydrogenase
MRFAIVGCGFVADYYLRTLVNHPELELVGVFDRDPERARRFASFHRLHRYGSLEDLLGDDRVELVANLTNPRSHFRVSSAALEAGKHVYSEKPLAMSLVEAERLVDLAERRRLLIASAPCSVLGDTAQTIWKALRDGRIGTPRLAYAEIDDGPIPLLDYRSWKSDSGAPWPAQDEFEVGCTLEHAGYYVTWLTAFFGPALAVHSSAHVLMPDKGLPLDVVAPDFTVGTIEFASGTVARITCSIYGAHDHRLRIYGDAGVLSTAECWDYRSPVYLSRRTSLGLRLEKRPMLARWLGVGPRSLSLVRGPRFRWGGRGANRMDFSRGIADLAEAAKRGRPPRMSARWSLHINEIVLALQSADRVPRRPIRTTFEPVAAAAWAA